MSKQSARSRVSYLFEGSQTQNGAIRHPGTPYDLRAALTVGLAKNSGAVVGKSAATFKSEHQTIEEMLSWTMGKP
jgi:hypothetical protein